MFNPSRDSGWILATAMLAASALTGCGPDSRASGAAPSAEASSSAAASSASAAAMASNAASAPVAPPPPPPPPPALAPASAPACPKLVTPACPAPAAWKGVRHGWKRARIFHRAQTEDRVASAHDILMGGPGPAFAGGYRMRETERTEVSRGHGGEIVERGDVRWGPDCADGCIPGWTGDWRGGRYRTAGIDRSGYLVWPGKIEY